MWQRFISSSQRLFSKEHSSILSAAVVITGSNLISALLGLMRNRMLIGRFFETESLQFQLDAYWVAFRLPELVFQLLVIGSLSAAFIPVYANYRRRKGEEESNQIASSMMNIVLLVFGFLSLVVFIFAEPFIRMITSANFSLEQVQLAANLSRIMILAQLFFAVSNFLTGIIQAHQRFLVPALTPVAYNLGIIAGIYFLTPFLGIYGAAFGVVIGAFIHLVLQLPLAKNLGYRYSFRFDWKHPGVKEIIRLMPPRTLAISVSQIELFASVYFATSLAAGSLTILNIAQQLMSAPNRIFSIPIGQASLPFLSKTVAENNFAAFRKTLWSSLNQILFVGLPAGMLLLILRIPLVRLVYGAPEFPWQATLLTGKTVAVLALSLFAAGGNQILVRAYYALHNTKTPFFIGLTSVVVNISLSALFVFYYGWGVLGIALAMTLATLLQFGLLLWGLREHMGPWHFPQFLSFFKTLTASSVMGLGLWLPMRLLDQFVFDTTRTVPLIALTVIVGLIGGVVFMLLAYLLKIPELYAYQGLLKKVPLWRSIWSKSGEVIETSSQTQEIKPM
jgi:putative peptidoglycan lipid II flippase